MEPLLQCHCSLQSVPNSLPVTCNQLALPANSHVVLIIIGVLTSILSQCEKNTHKHKCFCEDMVSSLKGKFGLCSSSANYLSCWQIFKKFLLKKNKTKKIKKETNRQVTLRCQITIK